MIEPRACVYLLPVQSRRTNTVGLLGILAGGMQVRGMAVYPVCVPGASVFPISESHHHHAFQRVTSGEICVHVHAGARGSRPRSPHAGGQGSAQRRARLAGGTRRAQKAALLCAVVDWGACVLACVGGGAPPMPRVAACVGLCPVQSGAKQPRSYGHSAGARPGAIGSRGRRPWAHSDGAPQLERRARRPGLTAMDAAAKQRIASGYRQTVGGRRRSERVWPRA